MTDTTRRAVVLGAGGAGLAAVLTACSGYGTASGAQPTEAPAQSEPSATASKKKKQKVAEGLARSSEIPEGGGKVFTDQKIVVTQPKAGEFKAFTAICTHQGCTVASVSNGTINCPCHGSKYNIADGSVAKGPASQPLAEKQINVKGGEISLA
ncbi:Rieske (2Fe-2S) protein [Nonomuraea sp. NPDC050536]|uniref:Rieske (2Fe-2S) protein n=1 Tax=Nonomuraea sp. NPDC050536 TaxID=3364366 RepID=UPI0037C5836D